ncbi:MAG: extracellular solute-binding protein [Lachnospiraceae bacterium]|nr:extracellular solute-binding protein [Lachnospiraceae bacterium]
MKKWMKRSLSLILAVTMVMGLSGCGGKKGTDPALVAAAKENVYKYVEIPVFEKAEEGAEDYTDYNVQSITYSNGRVVALVNVNSWGAEAWSNEMQLISVNEDGTDKQVNVIWRQDQNSTESGYLNNAVMSDNCVYGIMQKENYENIDEYGMPEIVSELVCWDFNANEQWRVSVIPEDLPEGEWFYVDRLLTLDDGRILVSAMEKITIYDKTGAVQGKVEPKLENGYNSIFTDKKGNLCVTMWDSSWTKLSIATLNMQTGQPEGTLEVPFNINNYNIRESKNYDMLLTSTTGIFGYNIGDAEPTPIMDFVNSDLPTTNLNQVVEINDTQFLASYYDRSYASQYVSLFTYVDPSEIPDKEVLNLAAYYIPYDMRNRVVEFNKTNEKYRIIFTDYSQYATPDDYLAGYTKFNNDIIAGNVPDIMILDEQMPVDSYIQKGLLADIYEFIDADEELDREDYFQNVFDAYSVGGKLYCIVPSFAVWTVMGKASEVGNEPGWTMKEMQELLASKPEGTSLFGESMTRESLMWYATMMSLPEFIDNETGVCSFESQGFKDLLTFLKTLPTEFSYDYEDPDLWTKLEMQYVEGKTLLMMTTITDLQSMVYTFGQFGTSDITFIGFPSENGVGAALNCYNRYAISAQSPNKEGAWEFMRYYYTDEYQESLYEMSINKDIWMEKAMEATEKPSWEDENGQIHYDEYISWLGGQEIILEPLTKAQVEEIFDYVSSVTQTYSYDQDLVDIINEEAAPFFEGEKSVDEVAKIIQGRIQLYVDESR